MKFQLWIAAIITCIFMLCQSCQSTNDSSENKEATKTPVTLTSVSIEPMSETVELNAISSFIRKNIIKASATGLIESIDVFVGDIVEKGETICILKTKEAAAYGSSVSSDTSLAFRGEIKIKVSKSGVISSISHQKGDYVQEGEELAIISEQNSLAFILEVPYEIRDFIKLQQSCQIQLPDNRTLTGIIERKLPVMDMQSQTENFVIQPKTNERFPENLIVKVILIKNAVKQVTVLPKPAVLSNETQTEFWVMKLINDSIAIKVPIKKGMESNNKVEILEPVFSKSDRILISGNYGIADTAKVTIKEK